MAESKGESKFERALQSWSEVNLPTLQTNLDEPATKIQTYQESSLTSRRSLAQRTKDFKKQDEDTKLKEIKPLLKLYQGEIDSLTERAKCAEGAFFQVYRAISELPDPKPLLEVSLDSVIASEEVGFLKKENQKLQDELLKYADYEQLKSKLLRMEQKSAEQLTNRLKLKEEELKGEFEEKEQNWKEQKEGLSKHVDELKKQVIELKTQTEVDGLRLQNQSDVTGTQDKSIDLELLQSENESIHSRNLQLEKRNQDLSKELKVIKSGLAKEEAKLQNDSKLLELESENATLVAKLEHEKRNVETNSKQTAFQINILKRDINTLNNELNNLRNKMIQYKDYDDLKQELNTLRAISFGYTLDDDDDEDDDEDENEDPIKTSSTQLDEILVSRNKKLTSEIADFRSKHELLIEEISTLKKNLTDSNSEVVKLVQLNNKLENDLSHFQTPKMSDTMSMVSGITRQTTRGGNNGRVSPASSIAAGVIREEGPQIESESSVLPIITSQRDRFRSRNIELESQLKRQTNLINDLKAQLKKLKQQNTELFERTRYLASYKGSVRRGGDGSSSNNSSNNDNDPEKQLSENYEESLHPLAKFRARELERVTSRLSTLERIFLSFAKAILANKTSRMLFLGYCVGLHCLVMAMSVYVMSLHGALTPDVGIVDKSTNGQFVSGDGV